MIPEMHLTSRLDKELVKLRGKAVWVYGTGQAARVLCWAVDFFTDIELLGTVDRKEQGLKGIKHLQEDLLPEGSVVLVCGQFSQEIIKRLTSSHQVECIDLRNFVEQMLEEIRFSCSLLTEQASILAPYPYSLYQSVLNSVNEYTKLHSYDERAGAGIRGRVFKRHDVDTTQCVETIANLLERDLHSQLATHTFIRTDGQDYDPITMVDTVKSFNAKGVRFGIHSACYVEEDYLSALCKEVDTFRDVFGFSPDGITFHGLGEFRFEQRVLAGQHIQANAESLGVGFADTSSQFRNYQLVLQDCNLNCQDKRYFNFSHTALSEAVKLPIDILILTHPCYWQ